MGERDRFIFSYQEIAECLIKKQGIHEGIWGIYVEFGIGAANIADPRDPGAQMLPAAIVPAIKMGIQRFPQENSLTVDAAKVNPSSTAKARRSRNKK